MSVTNHPDAEKAARQVLSGWEQIQARIDDVDPVEFAVREHGEEALIAEIDDAVADPLEADSLADERALAAMDGNDRVRAKERRMTPSAYLKAEYDVDATDFQTDDAIRRAVVDVVTEGEN